MSCVTDELLSECLAASLYSEKSTDKEAALALVRSIVSAHNDFVRRVSHPEPGMKPKKYFGDVISKFNAAATEAADQIASLY